MNFSDYCGFWLVSRLFRLISRRFFHSFYISTISSILLLIVLQFPLYSLIVPAFFVQNFIHRNGTKTLIHFSINVVIRKWPGSHRIHTQPVTHTHNNKHRDIHHHMKRKMFPSYGLNILNTTSNSMLLTGNQHSRRRRRRRRCCCYCRIFLCSLSLAFAKERRKNRLFVFSYVFLCVSVCASEWVSEWVSV